MAKDPTEPPSTGSDWMRRVLRALRGGPVDIDDLLSLLRSARDRNLIDHDAFDMIERVIQVSELRVRDVMLARAQVVYLDKGQSPEQILPVVIESAHSRFPVIDGDRDRVVGILLAKDLLRHFVENTGEDFVWRDFLRPAVFIPESKRLNVLLQEFRDTRNHMAIVVDEYGGVSGMVTIEDVLEQIVGNIEDEHDIDEEDAMIMQRAENQYVLKALLPIEDFNEKFGTDIDDSEVDTIGGMVVQKFGHVPRRGEALDIEAFHFEVLNADSRRVHLLQMTRITPS